MRFFFALQVVFLSHFARRYSVEKLTFLQLFTCLFLFFPGALLFEPTLRAFTPKLIASILVMAALATTLTFYLQTRYQKDTSSTRAGIIYALEPVFAVLFAYLIHGEELTRQDWIGGGLMLVAILIAELGKNR
ncbi:MAG: DMT family transporter [Candidatus Zixiibacteriota bacterium]